MLHGHWPTDVLLWLATDAAVRRPTANRFWSEAQDMPTLPKEPVN